MPRQPLLAELDSIPWTPLEELWPIAPPGPVIKLLSIDDETGAQTMLLKAPPGWSTPKPESHTTVQEDILLEGEAIFGETRYQAPAYFCFPANYIHPAVRTETGFTMIVTFSGPFDVEYFDEVPERQPR